MFSLLAGCSCSHPGHEKSSWYLPMEMLCDICQALITSMWPSLYDEEGRAIFQERKASSAVLPHHATYKSFIEPTRQSCYTCCRLLVKIGELKHQQDSEMLPKPFTDGLCETSFTSHVIKLRLAPVILAAFSISCVPNG